MHRKQQPTPVTITVLTQCYCVDTVQQPQLTSVSHYSCVDTVEQPQLTSVSHYSCVDRHQKTLVITPVLTETNIHWSLYLC